MRGSASPCLGTTVYRKCSADKEEEFVPHRYRFVVQVYPCSEYSDHVMTQPEVNGPKILSTRVERWAVRVQSTAVAVKVVCRVTPCRILD